MLTSIIAVVCILELIAILVLSICIVKQRNAKQEKLNTIIVDVKTRADGFGESTSYTSQTASIALYKIAAQLEKL